MSKEKPIIFNSEMVKAILEGRKTQTRREIKGAIELDGEVVTNGVGKYLGWPIKPNCPYGKIGDKLFVKEIFAYIQNPEECFKEGEPCEVHYKVDYEAQGLDKEDAKALGVEWETALSMPRWASRITLKITNIRVERLRDISEKDARKEGVDLEYQDYFGEDIRDPLEPSDYEQSYISAFVKLWERLKGKGSWQNNPFVWVIEFKVINKE